MSLDLRSIEDFPQYVVGKDGTVFMNDYGRLKKRRTSQTRNGSVKITLYRHGVAYTRSLALIVAQAYVYNNHNPEIFNTPIHLNNDLTDNCSDNLQWRPRWFALKYQRQYWNVEYRNATTMVQDDQTGELYEIMEACQKFGFLFIDVLESCNRNSHVFPTYKTFTHVYD